MIKMPCGMARTTMGMFLRRPAMWEDGTIHRMTNIPPTYFEGYNTW